MNIYVYVYMCIRMCMAGNEEVRYTDLAKFAMFFVAITFAYGG